MDIDFNAFVRQSGLPELAEMDREELASDFMTAAITGLADGDLVVIHPLFHGREADLYGDLHYGEGRVAKTIARTALENGMNPGLIYDFQEFAAEYFTMPRSPFYEFESESFIHIYPEVVTVDGNPLALTRPPQVVIDYGACLTGRSYIRDQMNFLENGERPFTYSPLTRLHFTNRALMATYDNTYGNGISELMIKNQGYIGREDGIASATDEMIRAQRAHDAPADFADIIICTGAQHTTGAELQKGIENGYTLLKEDGMLIIRALGTAATNQIDTDMITDWAVKTGFDERHMVTYDMESEETPIGMPGTHFSGSETKAVVISKK